MSQVFYQSQKQLKFGKQIRRNFCSEEIKKSPEICVDLKVQSSAAETIASFHRRIEEYFSSFHLSPLLLWWSQSHQSLLPNLQTVYVLEKSKMQDLESTRMVRNKKLHKEKVTNAKVLFLSDYSKSSYTNLKEKLLIANGKATTFCSFLHIFKEQFVNRIITK